MNENDIVKLVEILIKKNSRKYNPILGRSKLQRPLSSDDKRESSLKKYDAGQNDYFMNLIGEFYEKNYLPQKEVFQEILHAQGEKNFRLYLNRAIQNFLKEQARKQGPRSTELWGLLQRILKDFSESGQIDIFKKKRFRGADKSDVVFIDSPDILAVIRQHPIDKADRNALTALITDLVLSLDGWISVSVLHDLLLMQYPKIQDYFTAFLSDILKKTSFDPGDDEDSEFQIPQKPDAELYIRLNVLIKTLDERSRRIFELFLSGYIQKQIAEILTEEGMGCDHTTVSRELSKIKVRLTEFMQ